MNVLSLQYPRSVAKSVFVAHLLSLVRQHHLGLDGAANIAWALFALSVRTIYRFYMPTCILCSLVFCALFLVAPVDESALHVQAFWIKKIRMVAELPCVVVLGFLLGGIPLEGHIGSKFLFAFRVLW